MVSVLSVCQHVKMSVISLGISVRDCLVAYHSILFAFIWWIGKDFKERDWVSQSLKEFYKILQRFVLLGFDFLHLQELSTLFDKTLFPFIARCMRSLLVLALITTRDFKQTINDNKHHPTCDSSAEVTTAQWKSSPFCQYVWPTSLPRWTR